MRGNKFVPFLILSLALTAFLAGYIMVSGGLDSDIRSKTGTILDKFGNPTDPASSPQAEQEKPGIFPISSVKVVSVSNSPDRRGVSYFEKNTGRLFEFDFGDAKEKIVSDAILPNFLSSIWSPVNKEVLSIFYSPAGPKIKYHSYGTGKTVPLDENVRSAAFSPDGGLLAYYTAGTASLSVSGPLTGEVSKIYISQTDGTYPKKILDTRLADLEVSWPIKDKIAIRTVTNDIFLLTETGGLTKLLETKPNLTTKWSVTGTKLLFSYAPDPYNPAVSLSFKDVESKSEKDLSIPAPASKCVWSIDDITIFCAVSKTPSVDDIYKINTSTGAQELIAEPGVMIQDIFLPSLEEYLLFTNTADEKLYGIKLSD